MSAARVLRRRFVRRQQLVHARKSAKNEIHAVVHRPLQDRPPCRDLFGIKGRRWLAGLELPLEERLWAAHKCSTGSGSGRGGRWAAP